MDVVSADVDTNRVVDSVHHIVNDIRLRNSFNVDVAHVGVLFFIVISSATGAFATASLIVFLCTSSAAPLWSSHDVATPRVSAPNVASANSGRDAEKS